MANLGVIGEPCVDYIHKPNAETVKRLGGILYSVTTLSVISAKDGHYVYPVMNLGEDEFDNITMFLRGFKNIKLDYINRVKEKVRVVQLYYREQKKFTDDGKDANKIYDREESSTEPISPVDFEHIHKALNKLDSIFVNMISGVDITQDTLKILRAKFNGYIHLDTHNIVMKTYSDGQRKQEPISNWYDWCINCDTVQMNETEISTMTPEKLNEYEIADRVLIVNGNGPKAMVVTRGTLGISIFRKKINVIERIDISAIINPNFKDATGCGDTFGAGFFYSNATNKLSDITSAANFANRLASRKTELTGVEEMSNLNID